MISAPQQSGSTRFRPPRSELSDFLTLYLLQWQTSDVRSRVLRGAHPRKRRTRRADEQQTPHRLGR